MASNSGVQHQIFQQQQQQQQTSSPFQCKECGLSLNSAESLDVHLQYHKENLLKHWAVQASSAHSEETNNNMTKANNIKREFISNNTIAAADSSDMQKKSPEYNRSTPEHIFGHPPTPQSYQSGSSPYQNNENSTFSPNFQNFQIKSEGNSPSTHYQQNSFSNNYSDQAFFSCEPNQQQSQYNQDVNINKATLQQHNSFRYHPYSSQPQQSPYERPKSQAQVPSSSPAYPPQPTPSPSPKQCDKCGYVCDSASQLIEHINITHTPSPAVSSYQHQQHFLFDQPPQVKTEEDASQSEILDLDSHKVVHQVYPEDEKRSNGDPNPHSVSAMLNSWPAAQQQQSQTQQQRTPNIFQQEQQQHMFMNAAAEQKIFPNIPNNIPENKMFSPEQKLFQPHQNFINNGVTSTNPELTGNAMSPLGQNQQAYRPFEHLPSQPAPVISSSQAPNSAGPTTGPPSTKSASWKSNEARRPKTYNCTACNKWFTSSGHLKRHYNTTLHKNAVKSSGQPDPAALPISAHHHPARDPPSSKEDRSSSGSPREDSRGEESNGMTSQFESRLNPMPGLLQQPPNGPYDRQPAPNIHHTPPIHSPMPQHSSPLGNPSPLGNHIVNPNFPSLSNGSPPNGDAGLSPTNIDSRGLLSISSSHNIGSMSHGFNMAPQSMVHHQMESNQFQMYPNEEAPHVTQATAISNHSTTGEYQFSTSDGSLVQENQPLPSFAQIQAHRFGILSYGIANVGGGGSVTTPYYFTDQFDVTGDSKQPLMYRTEEEEYKLTVLTSIHDDSVYSPPSNNNNNDDLSMSSESDTKLHMHFLNEESIEVINLHEETMDPLKNEDHVIKQDYEENTGSPLITSTVPNQESKTKCFDCDKVFNRPCYLTQHNKTCHNGDKPFKCTRCGKRFSSEEIYREHASKHAGEKPHKCEICPKQFNHKTDLRRHMCCHTGRKPYTCETCGKGFIRKDHMVKHMETHLRKSQSKVAAAMRG